MLTYVDSSVLARAYLADEQGHAEALKLVSGPEHLLVTATWTIVEVTSALARAGQVGRADTDALLSVLAADTGDDGPITLLRAEAAQLEVLSARIAREHLLGSLDALHLAVAELAGRPLLEPGEPFGFVSRDKAQRSAARRLGFLLI